MKKLFLLLLINISCNTQNLVTAQSHTFKAGWCRYAKKDKGSVKGEVASFQCAACDNEDKKEQDAKKIENKRRTDIAAANYKAKEAALKKAADLKKAEDLKNTESGKVYINGNTIVAPPAKVQPRVVNKITDATVMFGTSSGGRDYPKEFRNANGETILKNSDWSKTFTMRGESITDSCIKNMGIVRIGDPNFYHKPNTYHFDIVNSRGENLFNDNSINGIVHVYDGWFLISSFDAQNHHLYNLYTKKKIVLNNIASEVYRNDYAWMLFLPIFSETIKLNEGVSYRLDACSRGVKENLIKIFPSQINESMLNSNSFIIVHCEYKATYMAGRREVEGSKTILLYCLSKDGELTTIKLK